MRDVSCVVDAAIAHENRMRQIHPRPDVGYRLISMYLCVCVYVCLCVFVCVCVCVYYIYIS